MTSCRCRPSSQRFHLRCAQQMFSTTKRNCGNLPVLRFMADHQITLCESHTCQSQDTFTDVTQTCDFVVSKEHMQCFETERVLGVSVWHVYRSILGHMPHSFRSHGFAPPSADHCSVIETTTPRWNGVADREARSTRRVWVPCPTIPDSGSSRIHVQSCKQLHVEAEHMATTWARLVRTRSTAQTMALG